MGAPGPVCGSANWSDYLSEVSSTGVVAPDWVTVWALSTSPLAVHVVYGMASAVFAASSTFSFEKVISVYHLRHYLAEALPADASFEPS